MTEKEIQRLIKESGKRVKIIDKEAREAMRKLDILL